MALIPALLPAGEWEGNPLQDSSLENPTDSGSQSQTWPSLLALTSVLPVDLVCAQLGFKEEWRWVSLSPPEGPPAQCSAFIVFRFFTAFEQRVLHSHFAPDPANYGASPAVDYSTFYGEKQSFFQMLSSR